MQYEGRDIFIYLNEIIWRDVCIIGRETYSRQGFARLRYFFFSLIFAIRNRMCDIR
jgi:hypothetical protein